MVAIRAPRPRSRPHANGCRAVTASEFGEPVELPDAFGFGVDTTAFRPYPPKG